MKKIVSFLLLLCSVQVYAQNFPITNINISMPASPNANTANWGQGTSPFNISAKTVLDSNRQVQGYVVESRILVTIKKGGSKICGTYTSNSATYSSFNTAIKVWNGRNAVGFLGQDCILPPGEYQLCVQFFGSYNGTERPLSEEKCKAFTIAGTTPTTTNVTYQPPQNVMPTDGTVIKEADAKKPLTFRWTPVLPRPQGNITYRLKVWQLMQGQNGVQAMKANSPLIEKDVENINQIVVNNLSEALSCVRCNTIVIWAVQALIKDGSQAEEMSLGMSEASVFSVGEAGCGTNGATVEILCDKIVEGVQAYKVNVVLTNVAAGGVQTCSTIMNTITSTTGVLSSIATLPATITSNGNITVSFIYFPNTATATTADFQFKGIWQDGNSNTSNFSKLGNILPQCTRQSCCDGNWVSEQWYGGPRINSNGTINTLLLLDTAARHGRQNNLDTLGLLPCAGKIGFKFNYKCAINCGPAQVNYKLYQITGTSTAIELSNTTFPNGANADLIYPTSTGKYAVLVRAICGKDTCNSNMYACMFNVDCTDNDCCKNSKWEIEPTVLTVKGLLVQKLDLISPKPIEINKAHNNCTLDLNIKGKYLCNNTIPNCQFKVAYGLVNNATPFSISGTNSMTIPSSLPNGSYTLTIDAYCGNTICRSYKFQLIKDCPQNTKCCQGSSWGEKIEMTDKGNVALPATESNLGTFKCGDKKKFKVCYNCAQGCGKAEIKYEIYKYGTMFFESTTQVASCNIADIALPTVAGYYGINISAICNGEVCQSLGYYFTVDCPIETDCCKEAHQKDPGLMDLQGNSLGISLSCSQPKVYYINAVNKNCDKDFIIKASSNCGTLQQSCPSKVIQTLTNNSTSATITGTMLLTVPATLPNGSYNLTIDYYCGDKLCKSCKFEIIKDCIPPTNCCQSANWAEQHWYSNNGANIAAPKCGDNLNLFMPTFIKCNGTLSIKGDAFCSGANCGVAKIYYAINNLTNGTVFSTQSLPSGSTAAILLPNATGSYNLEMAIICGKDTCKRCIYPFSLNCPPNNCCQNTNFKNPEIFDNVGTPLAVLNCDQPKIYNINSVNKNCDIELLIKVNASCGGGPNCTSKVVITLINNSTSASISNNGTLTIPSSLPNGSYTLTIDYYCGNTICKSCKFEIIKDCSTILDCCKGGKWENLSYTVSSPTIKTKPVTIVCGKEYTVECLKGGSINFNPTYICGNVSDCKKQIIVKISEYSDFDIENTGSPAPVGFDLINSGKYNITYYAKCGDKICDSCTFTVVIKSCPADIDCCKSGKWKTCQFPGFPIATGECPKAPTTAIVPSFLINTPITFNYSYICNTQNANVCTAKMKYVIVNPSGVAAVPVVTQLSGVNAILNMPSSAGKYCLKVYAYCGNDSKACDSCTVCFNVVCTDCKNVVINDLTTNPNTFLTQGTISSVKPIKQITAQLVSFSANNLPGLIAAPVPNFEFTNTSMIGGALVTMPFSLTGTRSNIAISNYTTASTSVNYNLRIKDDLSKRMKYFKIKFTLFFTDGSYCEYKDVEKIS
jgi:hypothetical protein